MGKGIVKIIIFLGILVYSVYLHQCLTDYRRCYNLLQTVTSEKSIYPQTLINW